MVPFFAVRRDPLFEVDGDRMLVKELVDPKRDKISDLGFEVDDVEPFCPRHLGLHVVAGDEPCSILNGDVSYHRVDLAAACELDLLERGADAGELKFDGLFLGHLAERLELD